MWNTSRQYWSPRSQNIKLHEGAGPPVLVCGPTKGNDILLTGLNFNVLTRVSILEVMYLHHTMGATQDSCAFMEESVDCLEAT